MMGDASPILLEEIATAQDEIASSPQNGRPYFELSLLLMNQQQFDWALDVAELGVARADEKSQWAPRLAAAMAHIERAEIKLAHEDSLVASNGCKAPDCNPIDRAKISLIHSTLAEVVASKLPPKEAYEKARRRLLKMNVKGTR